jgi:ribonucleoside-diphosphate reductase alpha chain
VRIAAMVQRHRKIGLGVMGFAEMLIALGIAYASGPAVALAGELMAFIAAEARAASQQLAEERGPFPGWEACGQADAGRPRRNATCTSIAPTGTIGIIAGTSAGVEPLFALAYRRQHVLGERELPEVNGLFLEHARRRGWETMELLRDLAARGSLAGVEGAPQEARALFRTALEIPAEEHLLIQAAFQKHVDNAVSKTINLPGAATAPEIAAIYTRAFELGLKGVTVYRYGSKGQQVLTLGVDEPVAAREHFSRCDPHACRV